MCITKQPLSTVQAEITPVFQNHGTDADTDSLLRYDYIHHQWFAGFDTVYMMIGKASPAFEATQTVVALFYRTAFDYGYKGLCSSYFYSDLRSDYDRDRDPDDRTEEMGELRLRRSGEHER